MTTTRGRSGSGRGPEARRRSPIDETGIGFYGSNGVAKPTITGSRAGNDALASLLTHLATMGLDNELDQRMTPLVVTPGPLAVDEVANLVLSDGTTDVDLLGTPPWGHLPCRVHAADRPAREHLRARARGPAANPHPASECGRQGAGADRPQGGQLGHLPRRRRLAADDRRVRAQAQGHADLRRRRTFRKSPSISSRARSPRRPPTGRG